MSRILNLKVSIVSFVSVVIIIQMVWGLDFSFCLFLSFLSLEF